MFLLENVLRFAMKKNDALILITLRLAKNAPFASNLQRSYKPNMSWKLPRMGTLSQKHQQEATGVLPESTCLDRPHPKARIGNNVLQEWDSQS